MDKYIETVKQMLTDGVITQEQAAKYFPELKESEDERMMHQLHSWMKEFGGAEEYTEKVYNWLQGLIEKQGEQKHVDIPIEFEQYVENLLNLADGEGHSTPPKTKKVATELLSLAYKEQKPVEWSEEDEKEYKFALSFSKDAYENCHNQKEYDEGKRVYNWLKSLRPQKRWKPSEEQIEALEWVVKYDTAIYPERREIIKELLEQIKKL